ncbi:MAG: MerR family transcriptional regulator, partial [Oscillospiraceae bacterium]|nr:MerR family transcriptional regulator [Oscillospiraceae bacterium]
MKINELAKISRVNPETIRMYRNKGLLSPQRVENGYFEYSWDDYQNLLYIRKLRGMNLSLSTISHTYGDGDVDGIVREFQQENDSLKTQIDELSRRQFMLQVTMEHYRSYRKNLDGVIPIHVPDERFDVIFGGEKDVRCPEEWLDNIDLFTQGLQIPEELLFADTVPEK